ncbi:MAG: FkbM family methyltransferase [Chthoniobacterales bacterium]
MTLPRLLKFLFYGTCPGFAGRFPYFGTRVFFPRGATAFHAACAQGIFEYDNVRILQQLYREGSYMFDVGANLGLMAIPILHMSQTSRVVSFEPSPNSVPFLQKTISQSAYAERWRLIAKAVAAEHGYAEFSLSDPRSGLYDSLKPTHRAGELRRVQVELTTLDAEWKAIGQPDVSIIKIDVEGAEVDVLRGALACLQQTRPTVLLEWNRTNLLAHGSAPEELLTFAKQHGYEIFGVPTGVRVTTDSELNVQMLLTESFLLRPTAK